MKKMSSLLYREWKISKKNLIPMVIFIVAMAILMWITEISIIESLKKDTFTDSPQTIDAMLIRTLSIMVIMMFTIIPVSEDYSFQADINSGWLTYSYALPVTPFERISAKFIKRTIICTVSTAFALADVWGMCKVSGKPFKEEYIVYAFIFIDVFIFKKCIDSFFILNARNNNELKKATTYSLISFSLIIYAVISRNIDTEKIIKEENSIDDILPELKISCLMWAVPVMIVLIALDFIINCWRMKNAYTGNFLKKKSNTDYCKNTEIKSHGILKGYIYKEFVQNRFAVIFSAFIPLAITAFFVIIYFFTESFTQEENNLSENNFITDGYFNLMILVCGFFTMIAFIPQIFQGEGKKLNACIISYPNGSKQYIYYKYVMVFMLNGIFMIVNIFNQGLINTVYYLLFGKECQNMIFACITAFYFQIFICAVDIPFIVKFGVKKSSIVKISLLILTAIATAIIITFIPETLTDSIFKTIIMIYKGEVNDTLSMIFSFLPYVTALIFVCSYKISYRFFRKGAVSYE